MTTAFSGVQLLGTGAFLPGAAVGNDEVVELLPPGSTTAQWITDHTGIHERHYAPPAQATSDLAAAAARQALADAGLDARQLDHLILCTTTSDWTSPAAASRVQALIGADCPAEDKQVACASWLFGLDHGARLCSTGKSAVMVIGADVKSRFVDPHDHRLRPVLADGAAAVILGPGAVAGTGLRAVHLMSDGTRALNMYTPAGGSAMPASVETVAEGLHRVRMAVPGQQIKTDAIEIMAGSVRALLADLGWCLDQVDVLIGHQANLAILKGLADELDVDMDRVPVTIDRTGNIVAATLPFTLDEALRTGRIEPGHRVVLTTAGAGYAGGAAAFEFPVAA